MVTPHLYSPVCCMFQVLGLSTNIQFLTSLAKHSEFEAGHVLTDFIPQHYESIFMYTPHLYSPVFCIFQVLGLSTNIQFLTSLAKHSEFEAGHVHTDFIPQHYEELFPPQRILDSTVCQAIVALIIKQGEQLRDRARNTLGTASFVIQ